MNSSKGQMSAFTPAFLAILNNVGPYLEDLSFESSSKIISLYLYMSSTRFMLANETNHRLLRSILEFINSILEHNMHSQYHPYPLLKRVYLVICFSKMLTDS